MIASWPSPVSGEEYAIALDRHRSVRLLILPALFDEGNKTRHFLVETMRLLDAAGVDCFLPDLPGCNESMAPLSAQDLAGWRAAAAAASEHFRTTHVLGIRAGGLLAPATLPGWRYAPLSGASVLRAMVRARILAAKEAGRHETRDDLLERGRDAGLELAGYHLGPVMISHLLEAQLPTSAQREIGPSELGGGGLWLRAEPDHDPQQAHRLAAIVKDGVSG